MIQVSLAQDDNPTYGIDLEKEIMDTLAKEITQEIDFEVMSSVLIDMGWHKIKLTPMTWEQSCDVDRWVNEKVQGKHYTMGLVWIFEEQADAVNFTLKWAE